MPPHAKRENFIGCECHDLAISRCNYYLSARMATTRISRSCRSYIQQPAWSSVLHLMTSDAAGEERGRRTAWQGWGSDIRYYEL